ncbi:S28 family serine protease [Amycolatopsis nigrescens]|uniref:S28 family serine protease n=1 Tax=Amycolatopsis nigrescens TaxID=381445 RepID=UPI0004765039|nr:S28 family serine protease [Amycolatopsis nigrescens]
MRRWFTGCATALVALMAFTGLAQPAYAAQGPAGDIKAELAEVPGLTVVSEETAPAGFRFFKLTYTQPADHRHPGKGTFQQRLTLLHRDVTAPTVMFTSGYAVSDAPNRSEPTQIVNGNQVSMEYRYFAPSRPEPADWGKQLTIWQAAADEHRVVQALKSIYQANWLATGGSKGGMTATYFRRFFPDDVSGTIPYVAPNDVFDPLDVYNRFLSKVGNDPACRSALKAVQRDALERRGELGAMAEKEAAETGKTFNTIGSLDKSLEMSVIDSYFAFWQYQKQADCTSVPAPGAPAADLYAFYDKVESLLTYSDQDLTPYTPYYYQAAVQLGAPESYEGHLRDLLRYPGTNQPWSFVDKSVPRKAFDYVAMPDIDFWVRTQANRFLFVYGENDPWSAEPFQLGPRTRDSYRYYVAGGNHGSKIAQLPLEEAAAATATVRRWAGLPATPAPSARAFANEGFPGFDADPLLTERPKL